MKSYSVSNLKVVWIGFVYFHHFEWIVFISILIVGTNSIVALQVSSKDHTKENSLPPKLESALLE